MRNIWKPEICHGIGNSRFEGWYYKLVDNNRETAIAIIPGFSSAHPSQAFIQIFNGISGNFHFKEFSLNEFRYNNKKFEVKIGDNHFSSHKIKIDLSLKGKMVKGELFFKI